MSYKDLADRVCAEPPSAELDALIRCALFAPAGAFVRQSPINGAWCIYAIGYNGKERLWEPPRELSKLHRGAFTSDLNAAAAIVPEGAIWSAGNGLFGEMASARVIPADGTLADRLERNPAVLAPTPAQALTAAVLLARAER